MLFALKIINKKINFSYNRKILIEKLNLDSQLKISITTTKKTNILKLLKFIAKISFKKEQHANTLVTLAQYYNIVSSKICWIDFWPKY